MSDLLFDTPWWVLGSLVLVGIGLFIAGNNRLDKLMRGLGIASLILAGVLLLTGWLVDTDREKCIKDSRLLVDSVVKRHWTTLGSLVAPQFKASILGVAGLTYHSRQDFVAGATAAVDKFGLKAAHITSLQAVQEGSEVKVTVNIYSEQDATYGTMLPSAWEFDWQPAADGKWEINELIALRIGQQSGENIRGDFPRGSGQ